MSNYQKNQTIQKKKGFINIQNFDDNECFKWCLVRYSHPADHNPRKITRSEKLFGDELDFEDIKFPVKIKDIHKFEIKQTILLVLVFLVMKIKKKYPIYVSKKCFEML